MRGIPSHVIRYFQSIPLFSQVSKKGVRALVQAATEVEVRAGKDLVRQGEYGRHLYVITAGTAEVMRDGRKVAELGRGDFFGELAFLSGGPRNATVRARTDLRVLALGPRELDVIVDREPTLARRLLEELARRVRTLERDSVRH
ncbi:MAG TPA: cyclic nucleotide-binding domain-containing protein [Actinomycetota bacterium]|nr:cyclic nucleotide-binding domain-containing protein [Actinomycetota bacterium]